MDAVRVRIREAREKLKEKWGAHTLRRRRSTLSEELRGGGNEASHGRQSAKGARLSAGPQASRPESAAFDGNLDADHQQDLQLSEPAVPESTFTVNSAGSSPALLPRIRYKVRAACAAFLRATKQEDRKRPRQSHSGQPHDGANAPHAYAASYEPKDAARDSAASGGLGLGSRAESAEFSDGHSSFSSFSSLSSFSSSSSSRQNGTMGRARSYFASFSVTDASAPLGRPNSEMSGGGRWERLESTASNSEDARSASRMSETSSARGSIFGFAPFAKKQRKRAVELAETTPEAVADQMEDERSRRGIGGMMRGSFHVFSVLVKAAPLSGKATAQPSKQAPVLDISSRVGAERRRPSQPSGPLLVLPPPGFEDKGPVLRQGSVRSSVSASTTSSDSSGAKSVEQHSELDLSLAPDFFKVSSSRPKAKDKPRRKTGGEKKRSPGAAAAAPPHTQPAAAMQLGQFPKSHLAPPPALFAGSPSRGSLAPLHLGRPGPPPGMGPRGRLAVTHFVVDTSPPENAKPLPDV